MVLLRWSPGVRNRSIPCLHSWCVHSLLLPTRYIFVLSLFGVDHQIAVIATDGYSQSWLRRSVNIGWLLFATDHECRRETHLVITQGQTESLRSGTASPVTTTAVDADLSLIVPGRDHPTSGTLSSASNPETHTDGVGDSRIALSVHLTALATPSTATNHDALGQLYLSSANPSHGSSHWTIEWLSSGVAFVGIIAAISSPRTRQSLESLQSPTVLGRWTRIECRVPYNHRASFTPWLIRATILNLSLSLSLFSYLHSSVPNSKSIQFKLSFSVRIWHEEKHQSLETILVFDPSLVCRLLYSVHISVRLVSVRSMKIPCWSLTYFISVVLAMRSIVFFSSRRVRSM